MDATDVNVGTRRSPDVPWDGDGVAGRRVAPDETMVGANMLPVRDRVQWGPILAGSVAGLAILLILTVLGLAIGASAFKPSTDLSDWNTWAGVWGGVSAFIAFLVGGWVAARTAAVDGTFAGLMNGLIAGATILLVLIILTATGLTNLIGFFGGNLASIANYATDVAQGQAPAADAQAAFDNVRDAAWGTLVTLVVALAAAALGGALGHYERHELIEGTG
ncbi:MAG: hypothetical protein ACJ789_05455 [Thermomicrobiales bacterium]